MGLGVLFLVIGFIVFAQAAPRWQQAQTWVGQLAVSFSPHASQLYERMWLEYYGSIAVMGLGGLLILNGLFGERRRGPKA